MAKKKTLPGKNKPHEDTLRRERETVPRLAVQFDLEGNEYPTDKNRRKLFAEFDRRWAIMFELERKYSNDKNPLVAWDAYIFARKWNLPIPPFFFEYLDASMEKFTATVPKGKEETRSHLVKSFGFAGRGQGSKFSRYLNMLEQHRIARTVLRKHEEYDKEKKRTSWEKIYKEVAEEWTAKKGKRISNDNVKDAYLKLKGAIRNP